MTKPWNSQYLAILIATACLLLFGSYAFFYYEGWFGGWFGGELQIKRLALLAGIALCSGRLVLSLFQARNKKYGWLQSLIPLFILFQLLLLLFDRISFLGALIVIPVLEIAFVVFLIFFTRKAVRENEGSATLHQILDLFLPSFLARWLIFEVSVISYAFRGVISFFGTSETEGWTYWKSSSFPLIFVLLILVAPIEILAIHLIFEIRNVVVHIVFGVLYVWALLYLYGFWISIKLLPHRVLNEQISVYRGVLSKAQFSIRAIEAVKLRQDTVDDTLKPYGLEIADLTVQGTPIVEIKLNESVRVSSLIGKAERFPKIILISADEPHLLIKEIRRISDSG